METLWSAPQTRGLRCFGCVWVAMARSTCLHPHFSLRNTLHYLCSERADHNDYRSRTLTLSPAFEASLVASCRHPLRTAISPTNCPNFFPSVMANRPPCGTFPVDGQWEAVLAFLSLSVTGNVDSHGTADRRSAVVLAAAFQPCLFSVPNMLPS